MLTNQSAIHWSLTCPASFQIRLLHGLVPLNTPGQHQSARIFDCQPVGAIALYAVAHQIGIVRSFVDQGRTGTTIKGRRRVTGITDVSVESGQADFELILVYDLSRWGRFVDEIDEGAHYEYLCTCEVSASDIARKSSKRR